MRVAANHAPPTRVAPPPLLGLTPQATAPPHTRAGANDDGHPKDSEHYPYRPPRVDAEAYQVPIPRMLTDEERAADIRRGERGGLRVPPPRVASRSASPAVGSDGDADMGSGGETATGGALLRSAFYGGKSLLMWNPRNSKVKGDAGA